MQQDIKYDFTADLTGIGDYQYMKYAKCNNVFSRAKQTRTLRCLHLRSQTLVKKYLTCRLLCSRVVTNT